MGFLRTEAQSLSLVQMHRTLFGYCEADASKIFDIQKVHHELVEAMILSQGHRPLPLIIFIFKRYVSEWSKLCYL